MKIGRRLTPGVYEVTWEFREKGDSFFAPGSIELGALAQPHGIVRDGDFPDWLSAHLGGELSSFSLDVLAGRLSSGELINIVGVTGSAFGPLGHLHARAALVGDVALQKGDLAIDALGLQVAGLFDVCVVAPNGAGGLGRAQGVVASVLIEPDASGRSREARAVELAFSQPITFEDCVDHYIEPLRRIFSVASGKPQPVTALSIGLAAGGYTGPTVWFDVFGTAVGNEVEWRIPGLPPDRRPAFGLGPGEPTLLDLVDRWLHLQDAEHPLVEIYGAAMYGNRIARARFLFAVQTIEGTWFRANRGTLDAAKLQYVADRDAAMKAVNSIPEPHRSFVRSNLPNRPAANLTRAIRSVCEPFLPELESQLRDNTSIQKLVTSGDAADPVDAVRVMRNGLSHGNRSFKSEDVARVANIMERAARSLLLAELGASKASQAAALET